MRETCHEVLGELGIKDDPLLDLAMELEKIALEDEYFVERKLYPNVDFYSGIIFKAIGIGSCSRSCRRGPYSRLDLAVERDDRGSRPENRPAAPAIYRRDRTRFRPAGGPLISKILFRRAFLRACFREEILLFTTVRSVRFCSHLGLR